MIPVYNEEDNLRPLYDELKQVLDGLGRSAEILFIDDGSQDRSVEILKEIKLGLQLCGRKLGTHIRKGKRLKREYEKRSYIEKYIPHIGIALQEILDLTDGERDGTVATLEDVLHRSRKF